MFAGNSLKLNLLDYYIILFIIVNHSKSSDMILI